MNNIKNVYDNTSLKGTIKIVVQKVKVQGTGAILLTGPSSCGKGEIAKALGKFLSIPEEKQLSMGNILRITIKKARENADFRTELSKNYMISDNVSVFDSTYNNNKIVEKALEYKQDVLSHLNIQNDFISQLDWLEFCVEKGLLVPDEWTENIISAVFKNTPELYEGIFILDGYPRTSDAVDTLLNLFTELNIPIIKVIHLSITKEQMKIRALGRKRKDDTDDSLERRYQFYVDKVQPCIDYLKQCLGVASVALIDAHQPIYNEDSSLNVEASIYEVTKSVMEALGLPRFMLDVE